MDGDDWRTPSRNDAVCPMCGESVADSALECPSCGEPLHPSFAVPELVPQPEQESRGMAVIVISLLFAVLGAVAGGVIARLWFGPSNVSNDAVYDLSICVGAFAGGVCGWLCCEHFRWHRNRTLQGIVVAAVCVLLLGMCVLSSLV